MLFAAAILLLVLLVCIRRRARWDATLAAEPKHWWVVSAKTGDNPPVALDDFPITDDELPSLMMSDLDEIEDEAAGYACYCSHLIEDLSPETVISVRSALFGTFHFAPDFEGTQMVGVKKAPVVSQAKPIA